MQQPLRPIGDLFVDSWQFFQTYWSVFIPIGIFIIIVPFINSALFASSIQAGKTPNPLYYVLTVVGILVSIWGSTAGYYALKQIVEGNTKIDAITALKDCKSIIIPLILTSLTTALIVFSGFIVFFLLITAFQHLGITALSGLASIGFFLWIIPAAVLFTWGFANAYIYLFEGDRYYAAYQRSKALTEHFFLQILGRLLLFGLAVVIAEFVLNFIPFIGSAIAGVVVYPFALIYMYLLYKDLRDKKTIAPVQ